MAASRKSFQHSVATRVIQWGLAGLGCLCTLAALAGAGAGTIDSLNAAVTGLYFYEGNEIPPFGQRTYGTEFGREQARHINWELRLKHPSPAQRQDFSIYARYYDPQGQLLTEHSISSYILPGWTDSNHSSGWGWDEPGQWQPGSYRVEIQIGGQTVSTGSFVVVEQASIPPSDKPPVTGQPDIPPDLGEL